MNCPKCKKPYLKKQIRIAFSGSTEVYVHFQGAIAGQLGAKPTVSCKVRQLSFRNMSPMAATEPAEGEK